ncbi:hypothetical protein SJA_C1-07090 [Sphingobium indicum UT26S]|uniref:Uncharacterized protein n=1 Tax=Sphingobium indicum (strain DSM 16413 / CCM 7287 / MTCC 6362 / UT26 / NBRC 101211 / UT26S) TaxID=452662 RepID=D4YYW1_SPHIU|nr:hypothetical protein SJA_C1-07090 [Sphingobium indicum UT26S]
MISSMGQEGAARPSSSAGDKAVSGQLRISARRLRNQALAVKGSARAPQRSGE